MYKKEFSNLIKTILEKIIKKESLKEVLSIACRYISEYYPGIQISFTEIFGKRVSYIAGAGKETYNSCKKIMVDENHALLIQNSSKMNLNEEDAIVSLFKIILIIKE